jgi:hypothetical protein
MIYSWGLRQCRIEFRITGLLDFVYCSDYFRTSNIKVIARAFWETTVFVLLMRNIYNLCYWNGLCCHIILQTNFHEDWYRGFAPEIRELVILILLMGWTVELGSGAITQIQTFMKISSRIQKSLLGNTQTWRHQGDSKAYVNMFKVRKVE